MIFQPVLDLDYILRCVHTQGRISGLEDLDTKSVFQRPELLQPFRDLESGFRQAGETQQEVLLKSIDPDVFPEKVRGLMRQRRAGGAKPSARWERFRAAPPARLGTTRDARIRIGISACLLGRQARYDV